MSQRLLGAVVVTTMLCSCSMTQKGALSRAEGAYAEGKFDKCLSHVTRAEGYGEHSDITAAQLSLQKGVCLEGAGRKAEANAVYDNLIRKHPNSDPAAQAKARKTS